MTQKITVHDVAHLAQLAKLKFSDAELEKFTGDLDEILKFFGVLEKINTQNTDETSQITGLSNVSRADKVVHSGIENKILDGSPHQIENQSVRLPKIM